MWHWPILLAGVPLEAVQSIRCALQVIIRVDSSSIASIGAGIIIITTRRRSVAWRPVNPAQASPSVAKLDVLTAATVGRTAISAVDAVSIVLITIGEGVGRR
jgi:hypothetical protein